MIQGKCPTCGKAYQVEALTDLPAFPFCSPRCRLIDLGRWADGTHSIPGPEAQPAPGADTPGDEDDD